MKLLRCGLITLFTLESYLDVMCHTVHFEKLLGCDYTIFQQSLHLDHARSQKIMRKGGGSTREARRGPWPCPLNFFGNFNAKWCILRQSGEENCNKRSVPILFLPFFETLT